jgi:hypothetical protein
MEKIAEMKAILPRGTMVKDSRIFFSKVKTVEGAGVDFF